MYDFGNDQEGVGRRSDGSSNKANKTPVIKRAILTSSTLARSPFAAAKYAVDSKSIGTVDEKSFEDAFEKVPQVVLHSSKHLEEECHQIRNICSDINIEWEKRVDSLRRLRSLLLAGAIEYGQFYDDALKLLEGPFQVAIQDLEHSQVVLEACLSIAYLSKRIARCDHFAEVLLPSLISLTSNSTKIISSSAMITIRYIIQYTHAHKLIPIIVKNISAASKEKQIRKICCTFLHQLLCTWSVDVLSKHLPTLQEAIKECLGDVNPEAKAIARKAFWAFADKFKAEGDELFRSLDLATQKQLNKEQRLIGRQVNPMASATEKTNLSGPQSPANPAYTPKLTMTPRIAAQVATAPLKTLTTK